MSQSFQTTGPAGDHSVVLDDFTAFCRSCGDPTQGTERFCLECGTALAGPADETASLVGRSVAFKVGLRRKVGVVLADAGRSIVLLVDNEVVETTHQRIDKDWNRPMLLPPGKISPELPSAAYRLLLATAKVNPATRREIEPYLSGSLSSVLARRSFAVTALGRGDLQSVGHSGLSATEQAWLLLWHHHDAGRWDAAFEQLSLLPPGGYPDKLGFIAAAWPVLVVTDIRRRTVLQHLAGVPHPLSSLLGLLLSGDASPSSAWLGMPIPDREDRAVPGVAFDTGAFDALRLVGNDLAGSSAGNGPQSASGPVRVLHALRHGRWEGRVGTAPPAAEILTLGEPVIDSLIDLGLVSPAILQAATAAHHPSADYLRARFSAGDLSDQELVELGHNGERARRLFLAGKAATDGDDGPAGPEERVFELLRRLGDGDRTVLGELVPLLPPRNQPVAISLGRSLNSGTVDVAALMDRSTWPLLTTLLPAGRELAQAPAPVRRLGEWRSLEQAKQQLFDWDWAAAADTARECLRLAEDEDVRDEALNLLACALYHQGNVAGSAAALKDALAGLDSPELIINYAIVAGRHDPLAAAIELARLAMDAPTLTLRVTAAFGARGLWHESASGHDNRDDEPVPPQALITAIRALSVEPTSLEDHRDLMSFLVWADAEWLADDRHTKGSMHAHHPHHQYLVARAKGIDEQVAALARWLQADRNDEWLTRTRDALVGELIEALDTDSEPALWAAYWSLELVDKKVPLDVPEQILLPVIAVREYVMDWINSDNEGYLKPELLDNVVAAEQLLRRSPGIDHADALRDLIVSTVEGLVAACFGGWGQEFDAIAGYHNEIVDELSRLHSSSINRQVVREHSDPLLKAAADLERYARLARQHVKDRKMIDGIDEFLRALSELSATIRRLPR